jgi:RNA chaperone Hfq
MITKQQELPSPTASLEEIFLQTFQETKELVAIYLLTGIRLVGIVQEFDKQSITLVSANNQPASFSSSQSNRDKFSSLEEQVDQFILSSTQIIYKHAISTISAAKTNSKTARHSNVPPSLFEHND